MKINIYYGGRGLIDDPTIYAINKLTEVLVELRVEVTRYNLFETKNGIITLPQTLKDVDGVILAATVEWFGIGGLMMQFLDACWLYGDKEKISSLYMLPVALATTYGERDAELTLITAWETLGGIPCNGLCAYVDDYAEFETNPGYAEAIEKKAEMLYRNIKQRIKPLPTSNNAVKQNILRTTSIDLTPQESEQLSRFISDDDYVRKQKEDIEQLTQLFKGMLGEKDGNDGKEFIAELKLSFRPQEDFSADYSITFTDINKSLIINIDNKDLHCYYGDNDRADVIAKTTQEVMRKIVNGRMTFQRAFMSGELSAKGDFKLLRNFDNLFIFATK